ncbi:MAG: hypothetical protein M3198_13980 [Actinomycetota bacterium]|nr:hypothetical protein [Actinomycetota bacterium]
MPLEPGDWSINGNGFEGTLKLAGVDAQGRVSGSVFGDPITGFWDEDAQKLTFVRGVNPTDPAKVQLYRGYQFGNEDENRTDFIWTLAGSFEALGGTGATANRTVYGWFARLQQIG